MYLSSCSLVLVFCEIIIIYLFIMPPETRLYTCITPSVGIYTLVVIQAGSLLFYLLPRANRTAVRALTLDIRRFNHDKSVLYYEQLSGKQCRNDRSPNVLFHRLNAMISVGQAGISTLTGYLADSRGYLILQVFFMACVSGRYGYRDHLMLHFEFTSPSLVNAQFHSKLEIKISSCYILQLAEI